MANATLANGLRSLPRGDRALLTLMIASALITLIAGVGFGAVTAFIRAGFVEVDPETGYRLMTLHGVNVFFYWLYFAQMALLVTFAVTHTRTDHRVALAPAAWAGFVLMALGFIANQIGAWAGSPLLYDGSPELVGEDRLSAAIFYAGYLALGGGLFLLAMSAIATALAGKAEADKPVWSTVGFGIVAWAGLIMVSGVATLNAFVPATLWAVGLLEMPAEHSTGWHLLFHNLHYLPLMGTVLIWYVLIREMTGIGSIFGERFSKVVFTSYLIFVPPTSLYHMFLEPGLAPFVRALGSLLSLFISVPTIAVFLVIVVSLETHARARGMGGTFGWLRILPWQEPAMPAIGMAVVNLALGGVLAFVLIQEQLAQLLSDTFFVPGYFHFLTIGTVSLTLLAALARIVPALVGRALLAPRMLRALPYVMTAGLVIFGIAGMTAGLLGMPRRVLDVTYDGAAPGAWIALSTALGIGGAIMAAALLIYAGALAGTFLAARAPGPSMSAPGMTLVAPSGVALRQAAWSGPLWVAVLVIAMYAMTALAFALLRALPVLSSGGVGH
jgi:cytochrome c oxidase subunit 1